MNNNAPGGRRNQLQLNLGPAVNHDCEYRQRVIALEEDVQQLEGQVVGLEVEVERLEGQVVGLEAEVDRLENEVFRLEGEVVKLKEENNSKQKTIENLQAANAALNVKVDDLQARLRLIEQTNGANVAVGVANGRNSQGIRGRVQGLFNRLLRSGRNGFGRFDN